MDLGEQLSGASQRLSESQAAVQKKDEEGAALRESLDRLVMWFHPHGLGGGGFRERGVWHSHLETQLLIAG